MTVSSVCAPRKGHRWPAPEVEMTTDTSSSTDGFHGGNSSPYWSVPSWVCGKLSISKRLSHVKPSGWRSGVLLNHHAYALAALPTMESLGSDSAAGSDSPANIDVSA